MIFTLLEKTVVYINSDCKHCVDIMPCKYGVHGKTSTRCFTSALVLLKFSNCLFKLVLCRNVFYRIAEKQRPTKTVFLGVKQGYWLIDCMIILWWKAISVCYAYFGFLLLFEQNMGVGGVERIYIYSGLCVYRHDVTQRNILVISVLTIVFG